MHTEAGQGTGFTMDVDAKGYLTGIVCLRTTVRRGQTECGLIYLVYGGDDEDHRAFALYLEVDSECRRHCGSGMLSAHIKVIASSILCMIGEVVEQSFKVEIEVVAIRRRRISLPGSLTTGDGGGHTHRAGSGPSPVASCSGFQHSIRRDISHGNQGGSFVRDDLLWIG